MTENPRCPLAIHEDGQFPAVGPIAWVEPEPPRRVGVGVRQKLAPDRVQIGDGCHGLVRESKRELRTIHIAAPGAVCKGPCLNRLTILQSLGHQILHRSIRGEQPDQEARSRCRLVAPGEVDFEPAFGIRLLMLGHESRSSGLDANRTSHRAQCGQNQTHAELLQSASTQSHDGPSCGVARAAGCPWVARIQASWCHGRISGFHVMELSSSPRLGS